MKCAINRCDRAVPNYVRVLLMQLGHVVAVVSVFIYSMPGYKCPVKERMLYSSCKAPVVDTAEQLGVEIVRKVRVSVCVMSLTVVMQHPLAFSVA